MPKVLALLKPVTLLDQGRSRSNLRRRFTLGLRSNLGQRFHKNRVDWLLPTY